MLLLLALLAVPGFAQTNIGEVSIDQTGDHNDVDAVCTATDFDIRNLSAAQDTVVCNAGSGTFGVGDGSGPLTIDGSVSADTELPAAAALADDTANPTITGAASYPHFFDGAAWDRFVGNSTDGLLVNLGTNNDVTVTGSVTANAGTNLNTSALLTTSAHDAAFGTAGSADAQVRSIQGIASMTPVQVQSNSANLGTETTLGGVLTSSNFAAAFGTAGSADSQVMSIQGVASMTPVQTNQTQVGSTAVVAGPCEREVPQLALIDQTAGEQLITGTASERIYICSLDLITATAQNVALVSGTGSVCATSTGAMAGGTTAATGWNFQAGGGLVWGDSKGYYTKTDTDADNVCLLQSASGQISGRLTYVSIPNI